MQAIRTIIWVICAVVITLFAVANFDPVSVFIWPGAKADTYLTVVILASFLLGFLPPFVFNLVNRWRLTRKIQQQEDTINLLRTPAPSPAPVAVAPAPTPAPAPAPTPLDPGPLL
jgi:lipopolysaccharide assembly protein A